MRIYDHTGEKIGTWTVVEIVKDSGQKIYKFRCDCGNEKLVPTSKVYRKKTCFKCRAKLEHDAHIGEKHAKVTCLGYLWTSKKRHGYLIRCDCSKEFEVQSHSQFLNMSSCKSCSHEMYPGKRIGNSILIERVRGTKWKRKCDCGEIFISVNKVSDCGCVYKKKIIQFAEGKIGKKFHFLTVKKIVGNEDGHILILVKCKCGKEFIRRNGHEFKSKSCGCEFVLPTGERAAGATLKNCEVQSMRELYKAGVYSLGELAKMFNKPEHYINRILNGRIWKHV